MTTDAQRGTPAQQPDPLVLAAERGLYGRVLTGDERRERLAAEFSLEFGPLLNVLDFPLAQFQQRESEPVYTLSMGERARWQDA